MLTLGGSIIDIGRLGTSGVSAVLNVANPWNTSATNEVLISDGQLEGAAIHNDGPGGIHGQGLVIAPVRNDSVIDADSGGTLVFDNSLNDWDGPSNGGSLRASGGTLELRDNASFLFNGTVEALSGTVFAKSFELEFDPGSTLRLREGVYRSNRATDIGGTVEVQAGAPSILQITATSVFENTSSTTLNDTLRLEDGRTRIEVGATFAGGGTLLNTSSHLLTLADGSNVNVLLQNEGRLALGASPGQATVLDYQQEALGVLEIELEGTGLNDYDRLTATALAQIDGELELSLLGGFNPALNDSFTILSAAAGVNGVFNAYDFSAAMLDPGLMWDVISNPTNVQLVVIEVPTFTADFDSNGDVDDDDLARWQLAYGENSLADADEDGDSDGSDFLAWQQQLGSVLETLATSTAVPEPESALHVLLAAACVCLRGFRPQPKGIVPI